MISPTPSSCDPLASPQKRRPYIDSGSPEKLWRQFVFIDTVKPILLINTACFSERPPHRVCRRHGGKICHSEDKRRVQLNLEPSLRVTLKSHSVVLNEHHRGH